MKKIIITWRRHRQAPGHRDGLAEKDRTGGVEGREEEARGTAARRD
jgi:hypothetical protein